MKWPAVAEHEMFLEIGFVAFDVDDMLVVEIVVVSAMGECSAFLFELDMPLRNCPQGSFLVSEYFLQVGNNVYT